MLEKKKCKKKKRAVDELKKLFVSEQENSLVTKVAKASQLLKGVIATIEEKPEEATELLKTVKELIDELVKEVAK